jgi:hypothetical protein
MLKIFRIRKLIQSANINTLDGDNQLHAIFYLHQRFIISNNTYKIYYHFHLFTETFFAGILLMKLCTSIRFPKSNTVFIIIFLFLLSYPFSTQKQTTNITYKQLTTKQIKKYNSHTTSSDSIE